MIEYLWRGEFETSEVNALHAEAFGHRRLSDAEWDWRSLVDRYSLGWVVAREGAALVGFVNVIWDGFTHAWLQDVMVAARAGRRGIGTALVAAAREEARSAGCEWLHVDFDDEHRAFYIDACGFAPASAGLIELT